MYLNQMPRSRILLLIVSTNLVIYFYWTLIDSPFGDIDSIQTYLGNITKAYRRSNTDHKENELHDDLKYILLWTEYNYAPFYYFELGQKSFIKNNCSVINCHITTDRTLFKDLTKFHAVAFNGRTMSFETLPKTRSPHQKYIYFNTESADNYPICDERIDGFFNWTATYKLNSDIPFPYIIIKNKQRGIFGPQINMRWPQNFPDVDGYLAARLKNKTKAAAWFVSNCKSRSGREHFVLDLQHALKLYGLDVDVFGSCGPLSCFKNETARCNALLENDYFFYLSLENSFAEDYVTEKLLRALEHYTVPIVYGGADHSRFLAPGSYIDSTKFEINKLAATMVNLMKSPEMYSNFFRWKTLYAYSNPALVENVCAVCAAVNNKTKFEAVSVYNNFREWWNPNYKLRCQHQPN